MSLISRLARPLALLALLVPTLPATAADPSELLPVDQAFVLGAQGKPDGIVLHWKIADGYYLYRQRISVEAQGGGFTAGALQLPDGTSTSTSSSGRWRPTASSSMRFCRARPRPLARSR